MIESKDNDNKKDLFNNYNKYLKEFFNKKNWIYNIDI